jgi:hypothetical protein
MKRLSAILALLITLLCASTLNANIYVWIDADGVKNFSNFLPPEGAEIFIKDSGLSQKPTQSAPPSTPDTRAGSNGFWAGFINLLDD